MDPNITPHLRVSLSSSSQQNKQYKVTVMVLLLPVKNFVSMQVKGYFQFYPILNLKTKINSCIASQPYKPHHNCNKALLHAFLQSHA